jgi:alkylhydroperoxidase/carboxymuconolactone decarboxylase family protein YurZ
LIAREREDDCWLRSLRDARRARRAAVDEIVEALLASLLAAGIHALSVAMPIFDDVITEWEAEQRA